LRHCLSGGVIIETRVLWGAVVCVGLSAVGQLIPPASIWNVV